MTKIAVAPMIDWTYTHFRVLMRLLAPKITLYTEMQTPGAILNQPRRALDKHPIEGDVVLQLGGSDICGLVAAAQMGEEAGFMAINLNLGCPSDKVQAGRFGACLMKEPLHVAAIIKALKSAVSIPITAKTRIGVDEEDSFAFFSDFVQHLVDAGCNELIVHARSAWLKGLSPKQNRMIPPLHYDYVYRIKERHADIPVILNGHVTCIEEVHQHLLLVDGVMLGRLACQNPYAMATIHHDVYQDEPLISRSHALQHYLDYAVLVADARPNTSLALLLKPLYNMMHGMPYAKRWKEALMSAQSQALSPGVQELHGWLQHFISQGGFGMNADFENVF